MSNINEQLSTHYLVYRIDNLLNGKYYIGQHKTINPYDCYMGSGTLIKYAVKCHGISAFSKTILFDFNALSDMDLKEQELVQLSNCYPYDPMSYNLNLGGTHNPILFGEANGMYGKHLKDVMTPERYEEWYSKKVEASRKVAMRQEWHEKMKQVGAGKNNAMYGKSIFDFMTADEILKWRENQYKNTPRGVKNGMYGKSSWEKCTLEQRNDRISRFKKNMKGKNKGKRCMKLPNETKWKFVSQDKVQEYLNMGYEFYSQHKKK